MAWFPLKIVSGGQTGVDRAALDVAIERGLAHGGWVPRGRLAEDDPLDEKYVVRETPSKEPDMRTEWNVRDSDATLILTAGEMKSGTRLTWEIANTLGKPTLRIDLDSLPPDDAVAAVVAWLHQVHPQVLNVAGPRASEAEAIYSKAYALLLAVLSRSGNGGGGNPSGELDVILARYQEALANFRHWDQIRWLAPYWLSTVTVGFGAILIAQNGAIRYRYLACALIGMFLFACICLLLMVNLIRYHNREIKGFFELVNRSSLPPAQRVALTAELPFKLEGRHLLHTATFYLIVLIGAIGVGSLCWLAYIHYTH
jgi:hypothetical protein